MGGSSLFDLCFLDALHTYEGIRSDYNAMAPYCRGAMLHDIQDTTTLRLGGFSGGTVLFWQHLIERFHKHNGHKWKEDEGGTMERPPRTHGS